MFTLEFWEFTLKDECLHSNLGVNALIMGFFSVRVQHKGSVGQTDRCSPARPLAYNKHSASADDFSPS